MRNTVFNVSDLVPVSIASGQSLSDAVHLGGLRVFGILMPAAWTSANLTFQTSTDNGATWSNLYDTTGSEITITAGASRYIALDPVHFAALSFLKIRSGTASSAVAQSGNRELKLILRTI